MGARHLYWILTGPSFAVYMPMQCNACKLNYTYSYHKHFYCMYKRSKRAIDKLLDKRLWGPGPPNISLCVQLLLFQKRVRHSLTSKSMTEIRSLESPPPPFSPPHPTPLFRVSFLVVILHLQPISICRTARLLHPKVPKYRIYVQSCPIYRKSGKIKVTETFWLKRMSQ